MSSDNFKELIQELDLVDKVKVNCYFFILCHYKFLYYKLGNVFKFGSSFL